MELYKIYTLQFLDSTLSDKRIKVYLDRKK